MLFENTWIMGPLIFYGMGGLFILEGKMCEKIKVSKIVTDKKENTC